MTPEEYMRAVSDLDLKLRAIAEEIQALEDNIRGNVGKWFGATDQHQHMCLLNKAIEVTTQLSQLCVCSEVSE